MSIHGQSPLSHRNGLFMVLLENGVIRRGHMENNLYLLFSLTQEDVLPTAQTLSLDFPDEPLLCGLHSKPHTVRAQNTLRSSDIFHIHSRKLTQMTKIGNGLYVLVLLNENEHGCNTWLPHMAATQSKPSQHDPSLIVHIPYLLLANKNQKCDKKVSKPWCECQAKSL